MSNHNHPFHLVSPSPWPLLTSISLLNFMLSTIQFMHNNLFKNNLINLILSILCLILCLFQWWRDVVREGLYQGMHTKNVYKGLRFGMILFIISEIFFFISFFWAFFHMSLAPSIEIGMMWPPKGIKMFNPYNIPMLNTIILVTSGLFITWCHHSILNNMFKESFISLLFTIILGIYFSILQLYEYKHAPFAINDSVYGSTFFMMTGFHGIHVLIGTIFLIVCFIRLKNNHFSSVHHFGFEAAAWYWHFVDVVWLMLYISIYWWPFMF